MPCPAFLLREEPLFPQSAPWMSGFFEGFPCSHHSWLTQLGSPEALGHRSRGQLADKKSYRFFTGKPYEETYQPTRTELAGTGSQLHLTKCGGSLLCANPDIQQWGPWGFIEVQMGLPLPSQVVHTSAMPGDSFLGGHWVLAHKGC